MVVDHNQQRALYWLSQDARRPLIEVMRQCVDDLQVEWGLKLTGADMVGVISSQEFRGSLAAALSLAMSAVGCTPRTVDTAVREEIGAWADRLVATRARAHRLAQAMGCEPRQLLAALPETAMDRARGLDPGRSPEVNASTLSMHQWYLEQTFGEM